MKAAWLGYGVLLCIAACGSSSGGGGGGGGGDAQSGGDVASGGDGGGAGATDTGGGGGAGPTSCAADQVASSGACKGALSAWSIKCCEPACKVSTPTCTSQCEATIKVHLGKLCAFVKGKPEDAALACTETQTEVGTKTCGELWENTTTDAPTPFTTLCAGDKYVGELPNCLAAWEWRVQCCADKGDTECGSKAQSAMLTLGCTDAKGTDPNKLCGDGLTTAKGQGCGIFP